MPKQTDYVRTQVRLPPELYTAIKEFADKKGLSINEAIINSLQMMLDKGSTDVGEDLIAQVAHQAAEEAAERVLQRYGVVKLPGLERRRINVATENPNKNRRKDEKEP